MMRRRRPEEDRFCPNPFSRPGALFIRRQMGKVCARSSLPVAVEVERRQQGEEVIWGLGQRVGRRKKRKKAGLPIDPLY